MIALGFSVALAASSAFAGPPYLTDDPEPVDLGHWEFYLASQWLMTRGTADGTAPHVEVNYGALRGLQLHVIVPAALAIPTGEPVQYGLGDIELGAKYRFLDEGERRPQIGTFPLVDLPTGSAGRGLGTGKVHVLVPIWVQKSFGRWTTYGGGGVRLASGERDAVAGWLLQRSFGSRTSLGAEASSPSRSCRARPRSKSTWEWCLISVPCNTCSSPQDPHSAAHPELRVMARTG